MSKLHPTPLELWLSSVGRAKFTNETGRLKQHVYRACQKGLMPSGWYIKTRQWCAEQGVDCPDHLFDWTDPIEPKEDPDPSNKRKIT